MTLSLRESYVGYSVMGYLGHCYKQPSSCISESCVPILGTKSNMFSVDGLPEGCPLSLIMFVIFMGRISRHSRGEKSVLFGKLRITSLLFADDMVLLASSKPTARTGAVCSEV